MARGIRIGSGLIGQDYKGFGVHFRGCIELFGATEDWVGNSGRDALRFGRLIAVSDVYLKVVLLFSVCVMRSHTAHTCAVTCLLDHTQES